MNALAARTAEDDLADWVGSVADDPLAFVKGAFPWGEKGTSLEHETGPDVWQEKFLIKLGEDMKARRFNWKDPVKPIRKAISSGHGVGKSSMAGWLACFLMSTRPNCRGTITANNHTQMKTKTWASVQKWLALCLTQHWFEINAEMM